MSLNENRIRDLAYQIWESEGRPHGQAARHWDIACRLAADSQAAEHPRQVSASLPETRRTPGASQQQAQTKPAKPARKPKPDSAPQMN
jgi:hypothetical protein